MKKKALSLALALVMCLGLTVPALAAEPADYKNEVIQITNVLDYQMTDKWTIAFTCIAPVKVTPGDVFDRTTVSVEASAEKIPDDAGLTVDDYYEYPYGGNGIDTDQGQTREGESVILTEPGCYIVEIWEETEGGGGFTRYLVTVQAGSETAPDVPVTGPTDTKPTDPVITVEDIPASGTAYASTQTVTVDGKKVEFQMYALVDANGNGTNYIKLRDMAYVLNGTKAQFSVGYDNAAKTISVTSGEAYEAAGSEMKTPFSGDRSYTGGAQAVQVNGKAVDMTAITLLDDAGGGYNYFKLRDLGKALGFNVGWSKEAGVFIETDKPYAE